MRATETDENPVNIGWNSHEAVSAVPATLVRPSDTALLADGSTSMRQKFEKMCRDAQISITKTIEEVRCYCALARKNHRLFFKI